MNQEDEINSLKRKSEEVLESEPPDKILCSNDSTDMKSMYTMNNNDSDSIQNVAVENAKENIMIKETNDYNAIESSSLQNINLDNKEKEQEPESEKEDNEEISVENNQEQKSESDSKEKSSKKSNLESKLIEENVDTNTVNSGDNTGEATASTPLTSRPKCKYGSQCYRLNADHKAEFSHPNDADYDVPDNKPECPYGLDCYRKNPQHKLDYKHTRSKRRQHQTAAGPSFPQDLSDLEDSWEESVDESDYDPSFIDDDSMEEFESDFEDTD